MNRPQRMEQQLEEEDDPLVIQRTADGYLVYPALYPSPRYLVRTHEGRLVCNCPDFECHSSDPNWQCVHIQTVLAKHPEPAQPDPETQSEEAEERAAIQAEGASVSKPPSRRSPRNNGNGAAPPAKRREPREPYPNGNGGAHMLIKRSISPDGRIDSVSVEFSMPVNGAPASGIKAQALRTLKLQEEIAHSFLNLNGNGNGKPQSAPPLQGPENEPPASAQANGEAIPARLIEVGTSNGNYGPRLFISVQANGKRYRLYGSAKQLAAYVGYAGQQIAADDLESNLKLNIPCRVVLRKADNGFVAVTRVLRPALPSRKGQRQWQPMPF